MATDEEITTEAEKMYGLWVRCNDITGLELLKTMIKKGIQMERERLRIQIKKDKGEFSTGMGGFVDAIPVDDLDIWDDIK